MSPKITELVKDETRAKSQVSVTPESVSKLLYSTDSLSETTLCTHMCTWKRILESRRGAGQPHYDSNPRGYKRKKKKLGKSDYMKIKIFCLGKIHHKQRQKTNNKAENHWERKS